MLEEQPEAGAAAVVAAGQALLAALQGQALVRESLASAAVALYAAAALPAAAPAAMARCLAQGLMLADPLLSGEARQQQQQGQQQEGSQPGGPPELLLPGQGACQAVAGPVGQAPALRAPSGLLDAQLRERGASLADELARLPPINRVCAIRGELFQALQINT